MKCLNEINISLNYKQAFNIINKNNNIINNKNNNNNNKKVLKAACGVCNNCKIKRVNKWQSKILLEVNNLIKNNINYFLYFITLTYNKNNYYKTDFDLGVKELQKWIKRIRGKNNKNKLKYFAVFERGKKSGRIHYHILLISYQKLFEKQPGGRNINGFYYFQNNKIKWDNGFHTIAIIKNEPEQIIRTSKYILKYIFKNPLKYVASKTIGNEYLKETEKNYIINGFIFSNYKYKKINKIPLKDIKPNLENKQTYQIIKREPKELIEW